MPAMVRLPGKGKQIAWNILGKPVNMQDKKTAFQKDVDKRLVAENTARAK